MMIFERAKAAFGLRKSKGLVAKIKTKRAIVRVRKDPRFTLYLCTLRVGLIFTPILALFSLPFIPKPITGHFLESANYYMKIIALLITVLAGIHYIYMEHGRLMRRMAKCSIKDL